MNADPTPDSFQQALEAVMQALLAHSAVQADPATTTALAAAVQHGPEEFFETVLYPWEDILRQAIATAFPNADPEGRARLTFVYLHAGFVIHQLEHLFRRIEGLFASTDKTHWVLSCYQSQCLGEPLPAWPPEPAKFWHPKTHTLTFWMDLIDQLQLLYTGEGLDPYLLGLIHLQEATSESNDSNTPPV